jgi:tetratricopeptide (TPR) repeat protein
MTANRNDEAVQDFSRGIRLNPGFSELYFNRAVSYFHMARYEEAIKDLTTAIGLNPGLRFRYYGNRGIVYEKMGMSQKALDDFSRALAIDLDAPGLLYRRGSVYMKTGNYNKALGDFTKAIDISAVPNPLYFSGRSTAYRNLGLFEEARRDADQAKKLSGFGRTNPRF